MKESFDEKYLRITPEIKNNSSERKSVFKKIFKVKLQYEILDRDISNIFIIPFFFPIIAVYVISFL